MSDDYPKPNSYSQKRFSEILAEGFYLFGKNWLIFNVDATRYIVLS